MFNFKIGGYRKKDGSVSKLIMVTGDDVDSTKPYAEEMKGFGAKWLPNFRTWGWFASSDPEKMKFQVEKFVKPAIEFLLSKESVKDGGSPRDIVSVLDDILRQLSTENTKEEEMAMNNVYMSKSEITSKIFEFKSKLVNTVSSEEFKRLLGPIMKFRRAQGYKYSLRNTILIWVQDPKATMVKSRTDWQKMNRTVRPDAPAISLFISIGGDRRFKTKEDRESAKMQWLIDNHYKDESELTPGDKERLEHYLRSNSGDVRFKFGPYFYDVRYTVQMEGKEDLVGSNNEVPWYNDSGNETMAVKEKIDALLQVVKESGVDVSKTKELGGALGVSKSGRIEVLDSAKMNSNYLLTICHEFAHEMLHQTYLKDNNPEYARFYYGRPEGKGFVEQQAELAGWIVCNFYGYDIKEAVNYAAIWGMNEKNAVHAFDTVAKVSDSIINSMNKKIIENRKMMSESRNLLNEVHYSGLDIARMVGAEDVYKRGMEEIENDENMKAEALKNFKAMTEKINNVDKKRIQENYD